jgi:hypothetical protein
MNRLAWRLSFWLFGLMAVLALAPAASAQSHSVDVLVADGSEVIFFEDGSNQYVVRSQRTGREALLTTTFVDESPGLDPDPRTVTFVLTYADGFRASGAGTVVIGTLPELPGPEAHPFGNIYVLSRLAVTKTSGRRGKSWRLRIGDELVGASEVYGGADDTTRIEGATRVLRTDHDDD